MKKNMSSRQRRSDENLCHDEDDVSFYVRLTRGLTHPLCWWPVFVGTFLLAEHLAGKAYVVDPRQLPS